MGPLSMGLFFISGFFICKSGNLFPCDFVLHRQLFFEPRQAPCNAQAHNHAIRTFIPTEINHRSRMKVIKFVNSTVKCNVKFRIGDEEERRTPFVRFLSFFLRSETMNARRLWNESNDFMQQKIKSDLVISHFLPLCRAYRLGSSSRAIFHHVASLFSRSASERSVLVGTKKGVVDFSFPEIPSRVLGANRSRRAEAIILGKSDSRMCNNVIM